MTPARPVRLPRREVHAPFGGHRLQRILGYQPRTNSPISTLVDLPIAGIDVHVAWVDATTDTPIYSGGLTAIHVLWAAAASGTVSAGVDSVVQHELTDHEVHPGDTLLVPPGVPFRFGTGLLAIVAATGAWEPSPDPDKWNRTPLHQGPTHGLSVFHRYNRRTICAALPELLVERWKLTEPLDLPLDPGRWHYLTCLVDPVAIAWPGGADLLGRTEARLLPAGLDRLTVVPSGLGYVLLISIPDLERDVLAPLRAAGYDRAAIASLGVPSEWLGR